MTVNTPVTYVEDAQTQTKTDANGQSYTSNVSNDQLTNEDFMKLMLEELRMQDPTKPMDTQAMMDSQLKMSTIQANVDMSESMAKLQAAYTGSALSTATGMIGKVVETGETDDLGMLKSYKINTVENVDSEIYVNAYQLVGFEHYVQKYIKDEEGNITGTEPLKYNIDGQILNQENQKIGYSVRLTETGQFKTNEDGSVIIYDENGEVVTNEETLSVFSISPPMVVYSQEVTKLPLNSVTQVRQG